MEFYEILCGIAIIFVIYYYFTSIFDFWNSRGIRGPRARPIFGTVKNVILGKQNMGEYLMEIYNEYKDESMIGIFNKSEPILVVKDPRLIKNVLIKDFFNFAHRGITINKKIEPLSQHLFNLEPKIWRSLRIRLLPAFSSGKIKKMFFLMLECADQLEQYVNQLITKNCDVIECRELMTKYITDVIGSYAFGIKMNALSDENSKFHKIGRQIYAPTWINILRLLIRQSMPWLFTIVAYILPYRKQTDFFMQVFMENIDYREKNNIVRHDFIDILRELKKHPDKIPDITLTDALLASQAFVFFVAGFETSSTTMCNALYELALNQKIQDKLREEIDQEYIKHNDITYDNVKKMTYLDKFFKETLRKYPIATYIMRQSIDSYTFDNTSITIPKNIKIWIPVYAIHRDPNIYPEPDIFDPERFDEQASHKREPMFYLPFGNGPRNCIGARFAIFQTKIGLIKLLRNYKIETCEKTRSFVMNPRSFLLAPNHGVYLKMTKIHRS